MSDDKVVSLAAYNPPPKPEKANPALPDHVWNRLQELGEIATEHLAKLLTDPRFKHFPIKDQMRVIETTMQRAYGSPDGSVRRNLHMHVNPEDNKGFNAMRELSHRAHRHLPEFRRPTSRVDVLDPNMEGGDEAVVVNESDTD
jgi:hypothetical protein